MKVFNPQVRTDANRRRTGRPRSFDETQAVETAMRLFWRHGYEGVGMQDLTRAIGVAAPSLYGVFGSKAGLYQRALAHYEQTFGLVARAEMDAAPSLAQAIDCLLRGAVASVTTPAGERGCMVSCGMLGAHAEHQALTTLLAQRRAALYEEIADRLSPWLVSPRRERVARQLVATMQGFAIQARDGVSRETLLAVVAEMVADFAAAQAWRASAETAPDKADSPSP